MSDDFYFLYKLWGSIKIACKFGGCNPMYYSLPGASVHGILQTRILEWVAISFSKTLSCITWDLVPWSVIKPGPTALGVRSLSHWTREVPDWILSLKNLKKCMMFMETSWKCEHQLDIWIVFRKYCAIFGEGNGTPLQYSCLENPMDGGA